MWWKTGFGSDDFQGVVKASTENEARQKWWENRCASHPATKEAMEEDGGFSEIWARPINEDDDGFIVVEDEIQGEPPQGSFSATDLWPAPPRLTAAEVKARLDKLRE